MLSDAPSLLRVSTGLGALDEVLGGLFWGENVVWEFDGTPVEPFYRAIAGQTETFETKTIVTLGHAVNRYGIPGVTIVDAAPGGVLASPGDLLREIHRLCHPRGRRLLLFEPLDIMLHAWGANPTREFFARCCPLLLDVGAIAYWSMNVRATPPALQEAVEAVTQCVLRVDERNVRIVKAEARGDTVRSAVLHWHDEAGLPALSPPELVGRVAASLRAVRRARTLSQHDLGDLAGVTASAISQAERGERGLSLATLVRLSDALGVTIDDLVRGEERADYQIGRRGLQQTLTLLDGAGSDVRVDLVHLDPREAAEPAPGRHGTGIVAIAGGLVQVRVADKTPALRHGEVLVADSERVAGWRNLGQSEALLFWIVAEAARRQAFGA
jgi:transcriptional regulator with XRE-family HTH domain